MVNKTKRNNSPKSPAVERDKVTWLRSNAQSRAEFGVPGMEGLFKQLESKTQRYVQGVNTLHRQITRGKFYR